MGQTPPEGEKLQNKHIEVRVSEEYTPEELVDKYGSMNGSFGVLGVNVDTDCVYFEGYPWSMYVRNADGSLTLKGDATSVALDADEWAEVLGTAGLS